MNSTRQMLPPCTSALVVILCQSLSACAATLFVAQDSPSPAQPYGDWNTAARTIQDAIDSAQAGDRILVTNGFYATGGRALVGILVNRVAVTKPILVESVNGPAVTVIEGHQMAGTIIGNSAVRCVYLTNGAVLAGFTLNSGATRSFGDPLEQVGGGICCESAEATVSNCIIAGNAAYTSGGGAYGGTLNRCLLSGNSTYAAGFGGGGVAAATLNNCAVFGNFTPAYGGGANYCTLNNCTLTGNSGNSGGGVASTSLTNCIVYYNISVRGSDNYWSSMLNYCCTTPQPTNGVGNLPAEPQLVSSLHLSAGSPCRGAASAAYVSGKDIDGEPWANPPSLGCDEYWPGGINGPLTAAIQASSTNTVAGFPLQFSAVIGGHAAASLWDFGDGTVVSNKPVATHAWTALGEYGVVLTAFNENYPGGISATTTVRVVQTPIHYVNALSANPVTPYISWATAAQTIQEAIDAATMSGALVRVTNGIYATGGRAVYGLETNRVAATKPLRIESVNGPEVTSIRGYQLPVITNGNGAARCVYLTNGAILSGFTLTGGATVGGTNGPGAGGGVWCESTSAFISNCVLLANSAQNYGGGVVGGTLNSCVLTANASFTSGGGACWSILNDCSISNNSVISWGGGPYGYGGGAHGCTLSNCTIAYNSAQYGGGVSDSSLTNCILVSNSVGQLGRVSAATGGGAYNCTLNSCTISSNQADSIGGGAYASRLINCSLTGNYGYSGGGAYRSTLSNCVLIGNSAFFGGGVKEGVLNGCVLTGNHAANDGGGAAGDTEHGLICALTNCILTANSAGRGGGAFNGTMNHCTLVGNTSDYQGGGTYESVLSNCLVYYNTTDNYYGGSLNYCCTSPQPTNGIRNFTAEPQLADISHLSADSPCRGTGSADSATGTDLDGEPWANPPSIGCDEFWPGAVTGPLDVAIRADNTTVAVGFPVSFTAEIRGHASTSRWDFGDGIVVSNHPFAMHAWTATGNYTVVLTAFNDTHPNGATATFMVQVAPLANYVSVNSANPIPPYTSWATAARTIQEAVDAAAPGARVVVTNGLYETGGRTTSDSVSNRVTVVKPIRVESVHGPAATVIKGYQVPGTITGDSAVRCVYLTNGAALAGFTLTNGATRTGYAGGGVACGGSTNALVIDCVITGNAADDGGGAIGGTLINCVLNGNSAIGQNGSGGGAIASVLNNCMLTDNSAFYGGGAYGATLSRCAVIGNRARSYGGGTHYGTLNHCTIRGNSAVYGGGASRAALNNCVISGNYADSRGGGAFDSTLNNCTVTANSTSGYGGGIAGAEFAGGVIIDSLVNNSIVYYNTAISGGANYFLSTLNFCCATPQPIGGTNNIVLEPFFEGIGADNLRLQPSSPCINEGNNAYVTNSTDLDGRPRVLGPRVDIGAYEYQPDASGLFIAWLQQYGLPTDGSADATDPDGDSLDNWQEWVANSNPTNVLSTFRVAVMPSAPGVSVLLPSASGRLYTLYTALDLGGPWMNVSGQADVPGTGAMLMLRDTDNAFRAKFYRVGIRLR